MTTNKFKKAMTLSVVPAVSLGLLAIPANAQEETDAVKETAEKEEKKILFNTQV